MSSENIYDHRISCLERMIDNTKTTISVGEHYITISLIERKQHKNALKTLEHLQQEYKKIYSSCEKYLK